jgi:DNA-binding NtrC family response regulator
MTARAMQADAGMTNDRITKTMARARALRDCADRAERAAIDAALTATRGVVAYAAKLLGMDRDALFGKLRHHYPDAAKRARGMRRRAGYRGGNLPLILKERKPDVG